MMALKINVYLVALVALLALLTFTGCGQKSGLTDELSAKEWRVTALMGNPLPADITITMEFDEEQVSGQGPCNRYFAAYKLDGERVSFEPAGSTMMFCEGEEIMDTEALFLSTFEEASKIALDNDRLSLYNEQGLEIVTLEQTD